MKDILQEVIDKINPSEGEIKFIDSELDKFLDKLKRNINSKKLSVEVFVGGSFAKNTVIKKDKYDVDVFLRFDERHTEISKLTGELLKEVSGVSLVHGSRDYYRVEVNGKLDFSIELIPVKKIKKGAEAENITDLSYSHVKYIRRIKNQKILDDIKIMKAFCYANKCYGAESYVNGFSGYAIELLVYNYGGFVKCLKGLIVNKKKGKIVIDKEKLYQNKAEILMDLNGSKLLSPIILIDPTYKQRNALAALSETTFERFCVAAEKFLKKPSFDSFELEEIDLTKIEREAKKKGLEFISLKIKTNRQEGDIAGTKLLKFHRHLIEEISVLFEIKKEGFEYDKVAQSYFVVKPKKEILFEGPYLKDEDHVRKFKKAHKNWTEKNGRVYAKEAVNVTLRKFLTNWKVKRKRRLKEMYISSLEIGSSG